VVIQVQADSQVFKEKQAQLVLVFLDIQVSVDFLDIQASVDFLDSVVLVDLVVFQVIQEKGDTRLKVEHITSIL